MKIFVKVLPVAWVLILGGGAVAWAQDAPAPLTVQATQQLRTLAAFKAARTPTQQKVSGSLLLEAAIRRGDPIANAVPLLQMRVPTEADGLVLVDIDTNVTGDVLATIADLGGIVVNAVPRFNAVRARLPFDAVELVAARAEVRSIRPADRAYTNAGPPSEGDVAHLADQARSVYGVDGTGVTVGVLSDSVDSLATLQASGDLPPACPATPCSDVLPGQSGGTGTSEGTAMMEIVHTSLAAPTFCSRLLLEVRRSSRRTSWTCWLPERTSSSTT